MTANKPGSVNQQPLYVCTGCYEDYSGPAFDLRVHDGECWCDLCWDERRWDFPDQPRWNDLEPYTPAPQAEELRRYADRVKELERFVEAAFEAHPNLDLDVAAIAAEKREDGE